MGEQQERDELYLRKRNLRRELRERDIRRDHWGVIVQEAQNCRTLKELDDYLDAMETHHSRFL